MRAPAITACLVLSAACVAQPVRWDTRIGDREFFYGGGAGVPPMLTSLAEFGASASRRVYVGGLFDSVGNFGEYYGGIAAWDGKDLRAVGGGLSWQCFPCGWENPAHAWDMIVWDGGSGPALYVGGGFDHAGSAQALNIARWDGKNWSAVGNGIGQPNATYVEVYALAAFDDGFGETLYAAGSFGPSQGVDGSNIVRLEDGKWVRLTAGAFSHSRGVCGGWINDLAVFDDGTGPALYAAGCFDTTPDGKHASGIAKWDGQSWSAVGSGLDGQFNAEGRSLLVHDDGKGSSLYIGGEFERAGGVATSCLARWDGQWHAVDGGVVPVPHPCCEVGGGVYALASGVPVQHIGGQFVGPKGPGVPVQRMYVGGQFSAAGGRAAKNLASWDGRLLRAVDGGVTKADDSPYVWNEPSVRGILAVPPSRSPLAGLYLAGFFDAVDGVASHCLGRRVRLP